MVKVCASRNGCKYEVMVLSSLQVRTGDVPAHLLEKKEERSKKFKHNWMLEQEARGNLFRRVLDDKHTLIALNIDAVVRDMCCTRMSLQKTICRRFHAFSLTRRDDMPQAFAILEQNGFTLGKPRVMTKSMSYGTGVFVANDDSSSPVSPECDASVPNSPAQAQVYRAVAVSPQPQHELSPPRPVPLSAIAPMSLATAAAAPSAPPTPRVAATPAAAVAVPTSVPATPTMVQAVQAPRVVLPPISALIGCPVQQLMWEHSSRTALRPQGPQQQAMQLQQLQLQQMQQRKGQGLPAFLGSFV
eukprot:m51a1_g2267 hypothetical protein (301) ;mRNA; f:349254-350440